MPQRAARFAAVFCAFLLAACFADTRPSHQVLPGAALQLDTIATGLEVPWAMSFSPDGRMFVSERAGLIRVVRNDSLDPLPWAALPVSDNGEAGLLGITVAPDFNASPALYVAVTRAAASGGFVTRILRIPERDGRGGEPEVIIDAIPTAELHAGTALAFGPDGKLYIGTGDSRQPHLASDMQSNAGKILRVNPDGSVPGDNPFPGSHVYASGFRNVQGITWSPDGAMFATEHGPSGFPNERMRQDHDELNVIVAGSNYGWPNTAGMRRNKGSALPIVDWTPAIAPSGLAVYTGAYEPWRGSVFIAALRGMQLRRVQVARGQNAASGVEVVSEETFAVGDQTRVRAVVMGPDGFLYVATSNRDGRGSTRAGDDMILRVRTP